MPCGRERIMSPSLSRLQDASNNAVTYLACCVTRALILSGKARFSVPQYVL